MYTFTRLISTKDLITRQLPALLVSLAAAETFFRFGSFALEAVAFLATWYVLDAVLSRVNRGDRSRRTD